MKYSVRKIAATSGLLIFALIALIALGRQATSDQSPAVPRAIAPLTSYDFGDVYKGEVISHTFIIRNEGRADLLIKEFTAG